LTELSVTDYFFIKKLSAHVGLAALLNAMDHYRTCVFASRVEFFRQLGNLEDFDPSNPEIEECRERLRYLYYEQVGYAANGVPALDHRDEVEMEQRKATRSPVFIAVAFNNQGQVPSGCNGTARPRRLRRFWLFCRRFYLTSRDLVQHWRKCRRTNVTNRKQC
jgi:hypothetical protein